MNKIVLQEPGTMDYRTLGVFDSLEDIREFIEDEYCEKYEDFKNDVFSILI